MTLSECCIRLREAAVNLEEVSRGATLTVLQSDRIEDAGATLREVEKTIRAELARGEGR
jgi:hypothetical protein